MACVLEFTKLFECNAEMVPASVGCLVASHCSVEIGLGEQELVLLEMDDAETEKRVFVVWVFVE